MTILFAGEMVGGVWAVMNREKVTIITIIVHTNTALYNLNFHPLYVVSGYRDSQLHY